MAPKAASAPKPKASSGDHGSSYQNMITDAIINLKERNGSSRVALKKYVRANNKITISDSMFDSLFNRALKAGVEKGIFAQPKGSSGGTKLAKKEPKPAAPKPAAKSTEKKTTEKKVAAPKKTATKKDTTTKAKAAPKTAAKTKAPAKPKTASKAAPKAKKASASKETTSAEKPAVLSKTKAGRVTKAPKATPKKPAAKKAAPKKATPKKAAAPAS